jgi:hypothetical protein
VTTKQHHAADKTPPPDGGSATLRLTADEVFQAILDQDPEEQRRAWLEFRRAIDEDRAEDEKHYPWPEE